MARAFSCKTVSTVVQTVLVPATLDGPATIVQLTQGPFSVLITVPAMDFASTAVVSVISAGVAPIVHFPLLLHYAPTIVLDMAAAFLESACVIRDGLMEMQEIVL